ncbi:MAG: type II secretion system F family protein [Aquificae bacterium]|nr:type II secretion system F family protein [Aquificota bacterium]
MPLFEYEAVDASGKRYRERIEAASPVEVVAKLRELNLVALDVRPVRAPKEEKTQKGQRRSIWQMEITIGKGVSSKDLSVVAKQLGALVQSGIGIVDALELVADSIDNRILKRELAAIAQEIREGVSLSKALERRKKIFGDFFVSMVQVGEETGQLDVVLYKVSDYYKRISEIVNKIKSASFYPAFVSITAAVITFAILYFLVPTFAQIYRSLGGELPAMTQMLIKASNWLQENVLYFLGGTLAFAVLFTLLYKKVYPFKRAVHYLQLKLPLFGPLFAKGALAKLSRTFATLFAAGVSVERALELSGKVAGNAIYEEALKRVKEDVVHGEPLWRAFEKTKRFPKMFVAMVKIGEETGQLDSMLESLADFYEDEVRTTIDGLISMIEPLMMVVIGAVVGLILIALYLPIFKMGELIR